MGNYIGNDCQNDIQIEFMKLGSGNYLHELTVIEVLGASAKVWADSAATRIANTFFLFTSETRFAEKKVAQPPVSKGLHLVSNPVSWELENPCDLNDIRNISTHLNNIQTGHK